MKRVFIICFLLGFWLTFSATGHCWPWERKAPAPAPKASEAVKEQPAQQAAVAVAIPQDIKEAPKPSKVNLNKEKLLREKKKSALNNSQWDIEVVALNGRGPKQKDILVFRDNKFSSENYLKQGFKDSNYTLTLLENDMAVVETMQTADKGGIIFWRIEFNTEVTVCKGVLSRQVTNVKTEDYSFVSIAKEAIK